MKGEDETEPGGHQGQGEFVRKPRRTYESIRWIEDAATNDKLATAHLCNDPAQDEDTGPLHADPSLLLIH